MVARVPPRYANLVQGTSICGSAAEVARQGGRMVGSQL